MTAKDAKLLEWLLLALGIVMLFGGWRTIIKRRTRAEGREYEGSSAVRLGWLWLILGILLILASVFDIAVLKTFGRLFLESSS
jgi:small-conductance mechanosensitive channel